MYVYMYCRWTSAPRRGLWVAGVGATSVMPLAPYRPSILQPVSMARSKEPDSKTPMIPT